MRIVVTLLALFLTSVSSVHAATIAAPPSYVTSSTLNEVRGRNLPIQFIARSNTAHSGNRSNSATRVFFIQPSDLPTEAHGIASQAQLKSLSRITGELGVPDPNFPFVEARNTSTTTRYFSFHSSQQATVPLDFVAFMDGTLTSSYFAELYREVRSSVRFALDVVDLNGTVLAPVFEARADNRWLSSGNFAVSGTSSGALDIADWQAAIGPAEPVYPVIAPNSGVKAEIDLFEVLEKAYDAPIGQTLGFRWTLETEARLEGAYDVLSATLVESDFFNTANLGLELNAAAPADTVFEELLTVAPVPIPPALLMFLPAMIGLFRCYRKTSA